MARDGEPPLTADGAPGTGGRGSAGTRRWAGSGGAAPWSIVNTETLVDTWRRLLINPDASWVLFAHGTCVVLTDPGEDLAAQATEILREFGPAHAGDPSGDFGVITPEYVEGWVVTGHHPDVLSYVAPDGMADAAEVAIGMAGRSLRSQDGAELRVVHVEDRRAVDPVE